MGFPVSIKDHYCKLKGSNMEGSHQLSHFFNRIQADPRISVTHIGIYAALIRYWQQNGAKNSFNAFAKQIMQIAKISSSSTYHKCIKELLEYGYIDYRPSFSSERGSEISLRSLQINSNGV